ncbi:MAG: hypothetical protein GY701_04510 [Sulfitobacter sp.]|nr:hypothetical protein [Sulfitobacter sp.]MCP4100614.1 hypothetical protein [Lentisphaerota bacterium]
MSTEHGMLVRAQGGTWSAPESSAYENEAHLQQMLAEQPGWIPGVDAPAFTAQELHTTAGPIDVCIVGSDGGLTVVECKLASNSEKRRMVVGQVIDYASAVWREGADGFVRSWEARTGQNLAELLPDTSMDQLVSNIESARIDLCLAVDEIDADLRRLVEFLNKATRPDVRVTALQLAYARQGAVEILVPSTYGGEIAETKVRTAGHLAETWTVESFVEGLDTDEDRALASRIMERAQDAEGPRRRPPLWFGNRPGGGIYLHPGGVSHSPAWIWVNSKRRLTICGTWKAYLSLAHHPAYARLAKLLGQSHLEGAKGVMASEVDLDELWPVLTECGLDLDAAYAAGSNVG